MEDPLKHFGKVNHEISTAAADSRINDIGNDLAKAKQFIELHEKRELEIARITKCKQPSSWLWDIFQPCDVPRAVGNDHGYFHRHGL